MRTKALSILATASLLIAAARLVHAPDEAHADSVPEKYRETVEKGLDYLARSQCKDGHWEGDGGAHPVAMTGLAGVAMLMERDDAETLRINVESLVDDTEGGTKHAANIRKAADWLMEQSRPGRDGLLFSEHASEASRYMQGHGLATLFLAGVLGIERDDARRKKLAEVLERAVNYIARAQSTQGGWYDTSKAEGHDFASIQATIVQVQALEAAENAGVLVPTGAVNDGLEYLRTALAAQSEGEDPVQQRRRLADMAAVLAGHDRNRRLVLELGLGTEKKDALTPKWFEYCRSRIPMGRDLKFGRDELVHFYYAQAEYINYGHVEKGDAPKQDRWSEYRTALFDQLQRVQNKDGSWPAGDGIGVGPVYATAVWCTILQLDGNAHPSTRRIEMVTRF
jgi:Prenyltransferase and squalene oxidase repeat